MFLFTGPKKFHVVLRLPLDQAGDALCVKHLNEEVLKLTDIPVEFQKLIYKGRSLKDPNEELAEAGLKNGSKVMLIGKRPIRADDENTKALKDVEGQMTKQEKKLSDITYELDGIHRGYLEDAVKVDAVRSLEKQMAGVTETCMKLLEKLDSLRFEEDNKEARAKRKSLVDKIQGYLSRLDGLSRGVSDMLARWGLII